MPRGVGKWSLSGESQSAFLGDLSRLFRTSIMDPLFESSSSIIVLSDLRRLRTCPGDGGVYVVAGKRSKVGILADCENAVYMMQQYGTTSVGNDCCEDN